MTPALSSTLHRGITALALTAMATLAAPSARADSLYDSLQFGPSIVDAYGYLIGEVSNVYNHPAFRFSPTHNGQVGSYSFGAVVTPNAQQQALTFVLRMWADDSGQPGTLIEQVSVAGNAVGALGVYTAPSALHPLLEADQRYWVSLATPITQTGDPNTNSASWRWSNSAFGHQISVAFDAAGTPPWTLDSRDFQAPMLAISSVPEPQAWTLLLGGLLLGRCAARRRRAAA